MFVGVAAQVAQVNVPNTTDETQEAAFSVTALLLVQTTIPRKTVSYSFECVIQIKLAEARP